MHKYLGVLLAACFLISGGAQAGNLTFDNDQAVWHSSKCPKPVPPASVVNADPETSGREMNALIVQYNAYADAAQNYMNCINEEAHRDQSVVGQAITNGAKRDIAAMQAETEQMSLRVHRNRR